MCEAALTPSRRTSCSSSGCLRKRRNAVDGPTGTKVVFTGVAARWIGVARSVHNAPAVSSIFVIVREDGIAQIRSTRYRDITDPYPESITALLAVAGLYVSALLPASTTVVLVTACLAVELWRASRAHSLLCQPVAEVVELPVRRRDG